jgi:hypothetical protein
MKFFRSRPAAALTMAAALSLTATPALARHRHHDRIDGGDIFAGLLVIGGIAAIASAASKKSRERREADYRYPDGRYPDGRYPDRDYRAEDGRYHVPPVDNRDYRDDRGYGTRADRNLDGAVDSCVAELERGNRRVDSVDSVNRSANGWTVEGQVDGRDFTCSVDGDGRIGGVTVDGSAI